MVTAQPVGDPADPATGIGPLVAKRQQERVEGYIKIGMDEGAKVVVGGARPAPATRAGTSQPTVFAGVTNDMRIAREEIFGPVLAVIPYEDEADAVRIANDSDYGLAGTRLDGRHRARHGRGPPGPHRHLRGQLLHAGVNAPFGGYKASGIGRELGPEGLSGYLEYKSIARLG